MFVQIRDDGELWIGSRACRYLGLADIALYGNPEDHTAHSVAGHKYLHVAQGGTLEMHGAEKRPWTTLDEHIFRDSVPAEQLIMRVTRGIHIDNERFGNRLIFHVLSAEGDLKEHLAVANGTSVQDVKAMVDSLENEEVVYLHNWSLNFIFFFHHFFEFFIRVANMVS